MLAYYTFYLPLTIESFFMYNFSIKYYAYNLLILWWAMQGLVNPFIYAWQNRDFSLAYRKVLGIGNKVEAESFSVTESTALPSRSAPRAVAPAAPTGAGQDGGTQGP